MEVPAFPDDRWIGALSLQQQAELESELSDLMDTDERKFTEDPLPDELPILPLRNTVLYPGVVIPITVARDKSIQLVKDAFQQKEKVIGVLSQKNAEVENPTVDDLHRMGTVAHIVRLIRMPDGSVTIVIQGRARFQIGEFRQQEPYFKATVQRIGEVYPNADETRALMLSLKHEAARIIELSPRIPTEANVTLQNINSLSFLVHFIASNLPVEVAEKQKILELGTLEEKATAVLGQMSRELQVLELTEEIQSRVKTDLDKQQRDYILRQQIRAIQDELGEDPDDADKLATRAAQKQWPSHVKDTFERELNKLRRLQSSSPEHTVSLNYLEWMLDLPWQQYSNDRFDLKRARRILDRDHYGLDKVKERIIEYLAVLKLKRDMKAPILCFYGPPGVGKTSLGKSIAEALGRSFVRMSLGGVRDEAEIRGHRRTYIGSMPGRILQGLKKSKTGNPVMILDEIDKIGADFRGDPASALLEVLDPEQNNTFNDHYLELDYDLSPVMFIATANSLDNIHPALLDRMEIIEINGYTLEEKVNIAQKYLLPKARTDHGLKENQLRLDADQLRHVIERYTRESGVRKLAQRLATVARGVARKIVEGETPKRGGRVEAETLRKLLGPVRFEPETGQTIETPGVAVGLAWTAVGGEILYIESVLLRAASEKGGGRLTLTGQLGEVMKESAQVAFLYLKAHAEDFGIDPAVLGAWDAHVHIPQGAVPKDGPSAGITLLTALASAYSQRRVRSGIAMTGEITLRGKVLPVGGIQEKVLAAARAGMHTVIMSEDNRKDVAEIKPELLDKLTIRYVRQMREVLDIALEPDRDPNGLALTVPKANGVAQSAPAPEVVVM